VSDRTVAALAALILARWWSRPTAEELESWFELWSLADETARIIGLDRSRVAQLRLLGEGSDADALRDEYERLLVGPGRPPCPPYESLWRDDARPREHGVLMGSAADEVHSVYGTLELRLRADAHELPDHLLVEFEAVAHALDHEATEAARTLLDDHLAVWAAPFCAAVAAETDQPFYAALARLTSTWTAALAAALR
jgi:TorA maturation chaperone TorD